MAGSVVNPASVASATTSLVCNKPTGTTTGDVLVAAVANDWDTYANVTAPAGWNLVGGYDNGSNSIHVKVWTRTADGSEGATFTFGQGASADGVCGIVTLRGVAEPTSSTFAVTYTSGTGSTRTSPTVSGAATGAVLICGAMTDGSGGATTWTPPSGMSEQVDVQSSTFATQSFASLLDPGSPTGTKDFTTTGTPVAPGGVQWSLVFQSSDATFPAQPTLISDRGTVANVTAATTSAVTITSPTTVAVGNYLVARVAVDNSGTNGAAPGCTVTDPRSNTWTVLGPALVDPGVASAGATAYLAYTKVTTTYQAADALTFNWGGISTTAKAVVVEEWSKIHAVTPVAVSAVTATGTASTAVTAAITPTTPNQLVYTCLATEGIAADTFTGDADTTNGSWVTLTTTASADATATNNQRVAGQYKQVTAAGAQSWDATITSRDWAAVVVVFAPAEPPLSRVFTRPGPATMQQACW